MKRMMCMIYLMALPVMASDKVWLWLNKVASAHDKQAVNQKVADLAGSATLIDPDDLPQWRLAANTNVVGWIVCLNRDKPNLANITKTQFDNWKATNMDNTNHLQVKSGDTDQVLFDAGLEPANGYIP